MPPNEELILGIDPGSLRTGFGIIKKRESSICHVTHGTIILSREKDISLRLSELAKDLSALIEKHQPKIAVVEDVFFFKNPRSALVLGQARGAILAILGLHGVIVQTLTPTEVKLLVAGRGRAQKFQVAQLIALELGIVPPSSSDASDALALALAFACKAKTKSVESF